MTSASDDMADADVLLLGASVAGLELHHQLRRRRATRDLTVAVVDRQPAHSYIPLVHERMSRRLRTSEVLLPTRIFLEQDPRVRWHAGEVTAFDPDARQVTLADGRTVRGRYAVVALGSTVAPPERFRPLHAFKLADELDRAEGALHRLLERGDRPHVLVVGGGITGVEMAGELAHLARRRPEGWTAPRITLVHGGDRVLPHLGSRASRLARRALEAQGVDLRLGTRLVRIEEGKAVVADGLTEETIGFDLGFWGGGVRPPAVVPRLGLPTSDDGWIDVDATLRSDPDRWPHVFAIGDIGRVAEGGVRRKTMQRAIECLWQAQHAARAIGALERGRPVPRHGLWRDFLHGISVGRFSIITLGSFAVELGAIAVWFRRFLLRNYILRYDPNASPLRLAKLL
jgi:NADH dehydrogenase